MEEQGTHTSSTCRALPELAWWSKADVSKLTVLNLADSDVGSSTQENGCKYQENSPTPRKVFTVLAVTAYIITAIINCNVVTG